jgi:rhodanese-related sulfurtransferase
MDSTDNSDAPNSSSRLSGVVRQSFGIFAAAVVLGFIYNNASPLGVKFGRLPSQHDSSLKPPTATMSASVPELAGKSNPPSMGYVNETVSMSIEAPGTNVNPNSITPGANQPHVHAPTESIEPRAVSWVEVAPMLAANKIVLIDVRPPQKYELAHIPGAISLPAVTPANELQAFGTKYPKETSFVVYCSSETCHVSKNMARTIARVCGYTNISYMPGGFAEYQAATARGTP